MSDLDGLGRNGAAGICRARCGAGASPVAETVAGTHRCGGRSPPESCLTIGQASWLTTNIDKWREDQHERPREVEGGN